MHCFNCGQNIRDGVSFCPMCGVSQKQHQINQTPINSNLDYSNDVNSNNPYYQQPQATQPTSRSGNFSASNHIISIIITIIIVLFGLLGMLSYATKTAYSEDALNKAFSEVTLSEIEIGDLVNAKTSDITLVDVFYYNIIGEYAAIFLGIQKDDVKDFLDSEPVKEFYCAELNDYLSYVLNDEGSGIRTRDIIYFVEDNTDLIEKYFHMRISNSNINYMNRWLDNEFAEDGSLAILGNPSARNFRKLKINKEISYLKKLTDNMTRIIATAVSILLATILILVDRKRSYVAFIYLSVASAILSVVSIGLYLCSGVFSSLIEESTGLDSYVIKDIISNLLVGAKTAALGFLLLFAMFTIIAVIIKLLVPACRKNERI